MATQLSSLENAISGQAAVDLGVRKCYVYKDGGWICDARVNDKILLLGFGNTAEEDIQDCARANNLNTK